MAWIPPGSFDFGDDRKDVAGEALAMGVTKPWYADEGPRQNLFLKGFYLDRYEVTHRRYKIFTGATGAIAPGYWKGGDYPEGADELPVTWVNWFDAMNFCGWAGKRLPTEKEWERAARGVHNYDYPWGNEFHIENANLARVAGGKNQPVKTGSFPKGASAEGVHDLIGNVWEWTADDYAPYPGSVYQSAEYNTGAKVLRGASASYVGHFPGDLYLQALQKIARNGYRQPADPDTGAQDVGFRCASDNAPKLSARTAAGLSAPAELAAKGGGLFKNAPALSAAPPAPGEKALKPVNPFEAKSKLPQSGILGLTVLSFIAGVFSFLSPCTLPILPAYFAVTAQAERARITFMSIAFFCGLATLFVLMGASASLIGRVLRDHLFSLATAGGVLVAIFGVMTIFGQGFSGAHFQGRPANTFFGSWLFGATFALGWTPCVGPVLSGILILAASDKTVFQGMSLLFFYAAGLGLPLLVITAFFSHLGKDSLFWKVLRGKGWEVTIGGRALFFHSTNVFSGLLLVFLGVALAMGYLTSLNSLIPIEIQIWFNAIEEKVLNWFM